MSSGQGQDDLTPVDKKPLVARLGKTNEIAPISDFLTDRGDYLLPFGGKADVAHPLTGHKDIVTIYEPEDDEKVIEFEVFQNYLSMIVEKDGQRQLKSVSLKTDKITTHFFDSPEEVCPVQGEISEFFEASFTDNLTFN